MHAEVAILGFGVVGRAVAARLPALTPEEAGTVTLRYVLDRDPFPTLPDGVTPVRTLDPILADPGVRVVIETLGGIEAAYDYTKRCLASGRHVVTSNKAVVAAHGQELLALAADHGVRYLYDASVAGGIPLLRNLRHAFPGQRITRIAGVLNGTGNYILTHMASRGASFEDVLQEAMARGYAERDPSDDVRGMDSARKLAIAASVVTRTPIAVDKILIEGIEQVTPLAFRAAAHIGRTIRHVALMARGDDGTDLALSVAPRLVLPDSVPAFAHDVANAIEVTTAEAGRYTFAGPGAGGDATAAAVVADVVEALHARGPWERWTSEPGSASVGPGGGVRALVIFPEATWQRQPDRWLRILEKDDVPVTGDGPEALRLVETPLMDEKALRTLRETLDAASGTTEGPAVLRFLDDPIPDAARSDEERI